MTTELTPETQPAQTAATEKTFTQSELDRFIDERLGRERRKAQESADKARQETEAKLLKEQGDYQKLAEAEARRAAELEATMNTIKQERESEAQESERNKAALAAYANREREGLPDHITALLDRMPLADQLEYISKHRDVLRGQPSPATTPRSTPAGPRSGAIATATTATANDILAEKRARMGSL